jgi:hypothetical protein
MRTLLLSRRPSPALVVACIAVAVALGDVSYATVQSIVPRNSVGTPQLKTNSVGTPQLKTNAVGFAQIKSNSITSAKVRDFSLRAWDFRRGDLPAGPRGPDGPAGPQGPAGAIGDLTLRENSVSVPGNQAGNSLYATRAVQVTCQAGEKAITGGTSWSSDVNEEELQTIYSRPLLDDKGKPIGWRARGGTDIAGDRVFSVQVLCAK